MNLANGVKAAAKTFPRFTERCAGIQLRPYQAEAAQAILDSIRLHRGDSLVIMMSRQAGKDELCANLKSYLLSRFMNREAGIVEVNPTYKPQTINAIERLERRLESNLLTRAHWRKRSDFMRLFGKARVSFLSGDAHASVVGATADLLLIVNEAQDIDAAVYDKRFAPMAASTNATRVFLGTAWTSGTLLSREMRQAQEAERRDGRRRVFRYNADDVRAIVPAYGEFVDTEIARLGRGHPLIKTQFFNEEVDAETGMFNPARRALMAGDQPGQSRPQPRQVYAFLIDVAGQDESAARTWEDPAPGTPPYSSGNENGEGPGVRPINTPYQRDNLQSRINNSRDSTALSIVSIDLSTLDLLGAPTYRVIDRRLWTGCNHLTVFGQLRALAGIWNPQHIVVDATGVGEGLWAMLDNAFPTRVLPVKFSASVKSEIGYRFLAIIETGRFHDCSGERASSEHRPLPAHEGRKPERASSEHRPLPAHESRIPRQLGFLENGAEPAWGPIANRKSQIVNSIPSRSLVDRQYAACRAEVLIGPQKTMRWGVPDGTRDENGELIHDDCVLADSLTAVLDKLEWSIHSPALVIPARDPLDDMSITRPPEF